MENKDKGGRSRGKIQREEGGAEEKNREKGKEHRGRKEREDGGAETWVARNWVAGS